MAFFYTRFHVDLIAYVVVLGTGHALESRRRLAEREEQLSKARLDALRHQLEPHFLFNTLNGISGLVRSGENQTAVETIAGFSDLLRRVIEGEAGSPITLTEELVFIRKYLGIQQMRFASRLRFEVDIPDELATARVPGLILQPVVENAIEHGICRRLQGGVIRIAARRVSGRITLAVENDGPALNGAREGVGIANTRARLKNLYGSDAAFELRDKATGCVEATITVPYQA
jgi:two-component system, LytTR family, sensor kinase